MKSPKRLGKIVGATFLVFIITSIIAVLIGFASTYFIKLVKPEDGEKIKQSLPSDRLIVEQLPQRLAD